MPVAQRKPPTLGEVIELRQRVPGSLESAAASINRHIDLFTRAAGAFQAHRVRAGFELIAVRPRIPHGEWENWCADNINRSMRDIQKLMTMAGADDPDEALERERTETRERVREHRAKSGVRTPLSDPTKTADINNFQIEPVNDVCAVNGETPVERLFRLFLQLDEAQRAEFLALVEKETE